MARQIQVPGASVAEPEQQVVMGEATAADPRDAEIARLRAELAGRAPAPTLVMEADGPNGRRYRAESQHLHLSASELGAMVRKGEVQLTDHHVLCKDGWYVNPAAQAQANG